ncbi:MAG: heterodisulfide reductase-related iron-sulfur binding cluster [Peptostreptococcus sp.]|uniref:(Fe-S)-binding protein n=1 Tax=Peptostreptococcus sp. TaxID=1262 RepID=UPI002FCC7649
MDKMISKECIHCNKCKNNCDFLKKYDLDLMGVEDRLDLAYHCFMCGKCKIVCPKDIDGRKIAQKLRDETVKQNNGKLSDKGYGGIVFEKKNYIFKNYKNAVKENSKKGNTAIFTGCNFLSYTPNTANELIEIMGKNDIGVIFDCCGKPIFELGLKDKARDIIERINKNLKEKNINRLVMVCPNCYYYFKGKLDVEMIDIYTVLEELGIGKDLDMEAFMFRPCPDRETEELLEKIAPFMKNSNIKKLNEQCCGAGGCASVKEGKLSKEFRVDIKEQTKDEKVYSYCSTCTGFFKSEGVNVKHVLSEILDVDEENTGNSLMNRFKYKFYR